jgi:hypothetical protein
MLIAAGCDASFAKNEASGNVDPPSWPTTIVVTPWLTAASASR